MDSVLFLAHDKLVLNSHESINELLAIGAKGYLLTENIVDDEYHNMFFTETGTTTLEHDELWEIVEIISSGMGFKGYGKHVYELSNGHEVEVDFFDDYELRSKVTIVNH